MNRSRQSQKEDVGEKKGNGYGNGYGYWGLESRDVLHFRAIKELGWSGWRRTGQQGRDFPWILETGCWQLYPFDATLSHHYVYNSTALLAGGRIFALFRG